MPGERPDPDELLARVQDEESRQRRGKLKIFLGPAAGVGKTYAMLEAACMRQAEGADVVAGYVETHGRAETEALLTGFEILPLRNVTYGGIVLREFDLDAALERHPSLILVDELAHTNAPPARHSKRWQDVQELLEAGINVYTTLNVQHLESLNDLVAQITGVVVRETVPDSVLEKADEVQLIDLAPDDLLQRLKQGKVYVPEQAEHAIRSSFRKGNLMALRELAMRRTADRVDTQMQDYMRDHAVAHTWPVTERILVSIGPGPFSARLVRAAHRMARALHAEWLAVYVETPEHLRLSQPERDRVTRALRLAEQLGAETATLSGRSVSEELLELARSRNVSKIVVGKPLHRGWRGALSGSVVEQLVRQSGDIDVHVITGRREDGKPQRTTPGARAINWLGYAWAILAVGLCSLPPALVLQRDSTTNIVMVYLLGVVLVAAWQGLGPSILASLLSVLVFDFFFVPPVISFTVADTQYLVTFGVMLALAVIISTLTAQIRHQAEAARQRERRTAVLYAMSRELAGASSKARLVEVAAEHIAEVMDSQVAILLPDPSGRLAATDAAFPMAENEFAVAEWVYTHNQMAGLGTETLPSARALYLPLVAAHRTVGVLGVQPTRAPRLTSPEQVHLLETLANQTAVAIERASLAEESQRARVQIETERMRNALLSSVSHDLKTPLAAITGAASSLLDDEAGARHELVQTIGKEADRLNRLIQNLLDMTRLESGAVQVRKEWHALEEIVGASLTRLDERLRQHPVTTRIPADFPLLPLDGVLVEQVLVNLLENVVKYTPPGTPIEIMAAVADGEARISVADRGPGIPPGSEERVFDKFYCLRTTGTDGGVGLGLTICRAIVEAHGGRIWAENRDGGGAQFQFSMPLGGAPPEVKPEIIQRCGAAQSFSPQRRREIYRISVPSPDCPGAGCVSAVKYEVE